MSSPHRATMQAALCLSCVVVKFVHAIPFEESEFSGGVITGRLLRIDDASTMIFLASAGLAFVDRRFAAAGAVLGCVGSLPLFLYSVAPGPFRALFPGDYKVWIAEAFVWDTSAVTAMVLIIGLTLSTVVAGARRVRAPWLSQP